MTLRRGARFAPFVNAMSLTFRLATSLDEEAQVRFWTSLSPDSMYSRFFTGNPNAFRVLSNDPTERTVMLAELVAGNVLGLGELLAYEDGFSAEVAFAVLDGHQGRGIAKRLLAELTHGVFRRSGLFIDERHRFDAYELTLSLDQAVPHAA